MSKYRLIKSFPNSPEVGEVLDFTNDDIVIDRNQRSWAIEDCSEYSEFWEQVKEQEFKIGDIVITNTGFIFKVLDVYRLHLYWQEVPDWKYFESSDCMLANSDIVIRYYTKQGWVKGAKFIENCN
jgi:hypothetical protein